MTGDLNHSEWLKTFYPDEANDIVVPAIKSVLIFRSGIQLKSEDLEDLRQKIVQQVKEGVVVLPYYVQVINPSDGESER